MVRLVWSRILDSQLKADNNRFKQVVSYIEENLDVPFDLEDLCKTTYLSKFHFHRQCSAAFGMPVMKVVKLLKLKRAAYQLAYRRELRVLDIALNNGYDSHEVFSRAFKKVFLVSPVAFRKAPDWTSWQSKYEPVFQLRNQLMSEQTEMNVDIVQVPEIPIAVLEHRGAPAALPSSIARFIEWRKRVSLPPSISRTFNLLYDDPAITAPDEFRFDLACSVSEPTFDEEHGIVAKVIPNGLCARLRHVGSDDAIGVAVNYLYGQWATEHGYALRDFPLFLERVRFFPEVPEYEMITDIFLPIQ